MGYNCICMENADRLISQIDSIEPSIILMDIEMPGTSGLEAVGILRRHQQLTGKVHVIIALTAHNDENILGIFATAGFDDYLQKPLTKGDLKNRLTRYIKTETDLCITIPDQNPVNGNHNGKLYSLDMFEADDPDFVRSIVEMFVTNTPGSIDAIRRAFEEGEMETLRQQAHKLKPHFSFFGAPEVQQALQLIEDIARGNGSKEKLPELIECTEKTSQIMITQMKADLLS